MSPFKTAGGRQFSRLLAAELCGISGSNAGYSMFQGSVKSTGYPLHSPVHLNRSVGVSSVDCWQPRCAASAVVMLDTPCSEVVWRVLATHCIRQFPLHFPFRASPCATRFQLAQASWNVMAHALKPDFVFRRNGRVHLNRPVGVSSVDYWQPRCAHQR